MRTEYRSGQGSIIPTLLIGVGGTGSRIVDRLAQRATRLPNWESQLQSLTHFLSIDTNEHDQHKLLFIPPGNRINIAAFDKARVIEGFRRSRERQALQWLPRSYQPRPGFKPGAGQIRLESRLGFFYHSAEIRQRLEEVVRESLRPGNTWRQKKPPKYNVYVYCTLAGGTGSGSFLPVAYLIDEVIREQSWQPRVVGNFLLSTLILDKVGPELHGDIHANTYAALKEIEHLTKLDYPQVKREGRTEEEFVYCRNENKVDDVTVVRTRPFFVSFLFDRPPHLGLSHAQEAIADAAFLQIFTPIIDNLAGELDNYEKNLEELTHFPGDLKNVGLGYTKNFGAFGAAALLLPGSDLLRYSALRFAAQAIRSQITFGVDRGDPTDDRARALARLAVNYNDPKFLNMSDQGREQVINQAFVDSVQEMSRQDAHLELFDGFWYRLVESVDQGLLTGVDDQGVEQRAESLIGRIERKLKESRQELLNKVSIKERAFVFYREGINQYIEHVSRLSEEIRGARRIVDEGLVGLETATRDGEVIVDLQLDPLTERYLALRLLEQCRSEWVPQAQDALKKASTYDIGNAKVRDRLENELFGSLEEAAGQRRLFDRDRAFLDARTEAQEYYRKVAAAARKVFDAEVCLRQLRSLIDYLERRARQYARLASRMDTLVLDLEVEAEQLRRGEAAAAPPFALRVEVFETLDEPRQRIWDRVYHHLYLDEGRSLATFDRQVLARTISEQLKPELGHDGRVAEKPVEKTVTDLRRALLELGEERLSKRIFGDHDDPGLDLARGLELEALLTLGPAKPAGHPLREDEIRDYADKKFLALHQLAGILARVNTAEARALDDGVKVNRTRQLIVGAPDNDPDRSSKAFVGRLRSVLSSDGKQVKEDTWHDPRLVIVHDVELPIPLYYFQPITDEIERAYIELAAEESRAYPLHTDVNWEKSLPNLNPRQSEITVGWSLRRLIDGLLTRIIVYEGNRWLWRFAGQDDTEVLGDNLSSALYTLGEIHHKTDLQKKLEGQIADARGAFEDGEEEGRRRELSALVEEVLGSMSRRELRGEIERQDVLDRSILRAVRQEIDSVHQVAARPAAAAPDDLYALFGSDASS